MFDTIFAVVGLAGAAVIGVAIITVIVRTRLQRKTQGGPCFFCARFVDEEYWCFGCEQYVCTECDVDQPWDEHDIDDHQLCVGCDFCAPTDSTEDDV